MEFNKKHIDRIWDILQKEIKTNFGKKVDVNAALFLIGIQELGKGFNDFTKEQKQDLIHIANCRVLSVSGFYELEGVDEDGWPHWKNTKKLPALSLDEQDLFLKQHIITYFSDIYDLSR